jgi:hypothetical protein
VIKGLKFFGMGQKPKSGTNPFKLCKKGFHMRAGLGRLVVCKPIAQASFDMRLRPTVGSVSGQGGLGPGVGLHPPKLMAHKKLLPKRVLQEGQDLRLDSSMSRGGPSTGAG